MKPFFAYVAEGLLLKIYVFTFSEFVDAVSLADPETKHNNMWRLLADLPPPNYHTLVYLRQHLLK